MSDVKGVGSITSEHIARHLPSTQKEAKLSRQIILLIYVSHLLAHCKEEHRSKLTFYSTQSAPPPYNTAMFLACSDHWITSYRPFSDMLGCGLSEHAQMFVKGWLTPWITLQGKLPIHLNSRVGPHLQVHFAPTEFFFESDYHTCFFVTAGSPLP